VLRRLDCSRGSRVKVSLEGREVDGTFDDYGALDVVRIKNEEGFVLIRTQDVVSVDYQSN
jgi:hypothetical protein